MTTFSNDNELKIDAVITWVDGNDPVWQEKINQYKKVKLNFKSESYKKRYNSIGEVDIAIKAIIKFANFIKNIYLVTDNQKPEKFESLKKLAQKNGMNLHLVDHKIIFRDYEKCLPTFNSCSIGCMLYRIPNLAEHFILFNDDTFIMRTTKPSDFFINGKPIIRGKKELFREDRLLRSYYHSFLKFLGKEPKEKNSSFKNFQETSVKLAYGGKPKHYVRRLHTPVCIRKSTLKNFFEKNKVLEENIKHQFRDKSQFIISSLSEHLELKETRENYRSDSQLTYFRSYKRPWLVRRKLHQFLNDSNKLFMTFQSLDMADKDTFSYISNWINQRIRF